MYLYESARWCQHMDPKPVRPPKTRLLRGSMQKAAKPLDGKYDGIKPGHWYSPCMDSVRMMMFKAGAIPIIYLDHKGMDIQRLVARSDEGDGVVSYVEDDSMEAIEMFLKHFDKRLIL